MKNIVSKYNVKNYRLKYSVKKSILQSDMHKVAYTKWHVKKVINLQVDKYSQFILCAQLKFITRDANQSKQQIKTHRYNVTNNRSYRGTGKMLQIIDHMAPHG